jgi:predicted AAA+ superfamily ATPase
MKFVNRLLELPLSQSFFLFGARNTGKSTLLKHTFGAKRALWIDLLDPDQEDRYAREPASFKQEVMALDETTPYVIIDEIQKLPKLLNIVHQLIESTNKIFIMTGSSARKLRHGGANLLAGRAFMYNLYPFTALELGKSFNLDAALRWGTLPAIIYKMQSEEDKNLFLQAYAQTYLKEEIWLEQFIRKIDPFRKFLEVSAQCNGQILNFSKIARDVGVDDKTIQQYFSILEDTLMGFMLEPFHASFRKRLHAKPKFYFFDTGVCRALTRTLSVPLKKSSSEYGHYFEHFIILECIRLASCYYPEFRFSYLKTRDGVEIDLIVERPGQKNLLIEIKSSDHVREDKLSSFMGLAKDIENSEAICLSQETRPKKIGDVMVWPWMEALHKYFIPEGGCYSG